MEKPFRFTGYDNPTVPLGYVPEISAEASRIPLPVPLSPGDVN